MYASKLNSIYGNRLDEYALHAKALEKVKEKKEQPPKEDSIEISPEGRLAAGQAVETAEAADAGAEGTDGADETGSSEKQSGKVAVNEGKRIRQIAAAQSRGQVQQVLALLQQDLSDCKAGLEKGWCDESEIAKVEALISRAKARMSEVPQESAENQGGLDAFAMASLM